MWQTHSCLRVLIKTADSITDKLFVSGVMEFKLVISGM